MRRQHVVIGGDDAEVRNLVAGQRRLVVRAAGGKTMGEIGTGQNRAVRLLRSSLAHTAKIGLSGRLGRSRMRAVISCMRLCADCMGMGITCANLA